MAHIAFKTYCQSNIGEIPAVNNKRFQIGIIVSPDVNFRTIKNNDGSATSKMIIDQRNTREIAKPGYTAGLNVSYKIKKMVELETGIQYSFKGFQTKMYEVNSVIEDPVIPDKAKFINNFHYADIPVKANFKIGKNRLSFFAGIGLTTNIFISEIQTSILVYSDHTERKTYPTNIEYKRINVSPTISFGIDYNIDERSNLRIEPIFRYGVLKIIDTPVAGYLYNGGINISYYIG